MRSTNTPGTFLTNLLLTSSSLRVMFCDRPLRASLSVESPPAPFAPPHRTRRSGIGVSPLAQLGAEFPERYVRKLSRVLTGNLPLLMKRFAVPSARVFL